MFAHGSVFLLFASCWIIATRETERRPVFLCSRWATIILFRAHYQGTYPFDFRRDTYYSVLNRRTVSIGDETEEKSLPGKPIVLHYMAYSPQYVICILLEPDDLSLFESMENRIRMFSSGLKTGVKSHKIHFV